MDGHGVRDDLGESRKIMTTGHEETIGHQETLHGSNAEPHARRANRLIESTSPYLLQHAHNPVDWYPWGPEALERSRQENKPIFLSIGYAACHWCHVMERECFEN